MIDREDISASLSGFDQLDGGGRIGLGQTYSVLKRDITTAGGDLVDIVAYNRFGLDQPVNLRGPNGTVLTTMTSCSMPWHASTEFRGRGRVRGKEIALGFGSGLGLGVGLGVGLGSRLGLKLG